LGVWFEDCYQLVLNKEQKMEMDKNSTTPKPNTEQNPVVPTPMKRRAESRSSQARPSADQEMPAKLDIISDLREETEKMDLAVRNLIKRNPIATVAGVVFLGFVGGMILKRFNSESESVST
jgi:hypothetical protein